MILGNKKIQFSVFYVVREFVKIILRNRIGS